MQMGCCVDEAVHDMRTGASIVSLSAAVAGAYAAAFMLPYRLLRMNNAPRSGSTLQHAVQSTGYPGLVGLHCPHEAVTVTPHPDLSMLLRSPAGLSPEIAFFKKWEEASEDYPKAHAGDVGGADFFVKPQACRPSPWMCMISRRAPCQLKCC